MSVNVKLLYCTPNPERAIATAARLCYAPIGAEELIETMSDEEVQKILNIVLRSGHFSTLEHASFTFAAEDLSRACTHQLVRHRLASYNQQSQRYVGFDNTSIITIEPDTIKENTEADAVFNSAMNEAKLAYTKLVELGIPKEDARFVLPNAAETKIVITMNARELMHFFSIRCCNRAQWEIRDLAWQMLKLAQEQAPNVFKTAGPACVRGNCPEGKMTCGNPYPKA